MAIDESYLNSLSVEELRRELRNARCCRASPATKSGPERVDAAAKLIADWIRYSWDGMREDRARGFPEWYNGIGTLNYQGGKQGLRELALQIDAALNGEELASATNESKEHEALLSVETAMEMLRNAIVKRDPPRELEVRVQDVLNELRAIIHPGLPT